MATKIQAQVFNKMQTQVKVFITQCKELKSNNQPTKYLLKSILVEIKERELMIKTKEGNQDKVRIRKEVKKVIKGNQKKDDNILYLI
jgi:hypothetical protein